MSNLTEYALIYLNGEVNNIQKAKEELKLNNIDGLNILELKEIDPEHLEFKIFLNYLIEYLPETALINIAKKYLLKVEVDIINLLSEDLEGNKMDTCVDKYYLGNYKYYVKFDNKEDEEKALKEIQEKYSLNKQHPELIMFITDNEYNLHNKKEVEDFILSMSNKFDDLYSNSNFSDLEIKDLKDKLLEFIVVFIKTEYDINVDLSLKSI